MSNWIWLDERDAVALHDQSLVAHGGAAGLRDEGLLQSALIRPQQVFSYSEQVDVFSLAASYTSSIIQNHPFVDGNKRTGFILGILFLEMNGEEFIASEEAAAFAVLALASGETNEVEYAKFLKANVRSA